MLRFKSERRASSRTSCDATCKIGAPHRTLIGIILNASAGGAECEIRNGLMPSRGETVYLEWPDSSAVCAQVAWSDRNRIGLRFLTLEPRFADRLDIADLGFDSYRRILLGQTLRQARS